MEETKYLLSQTPADPGLSIPTRISSEPAKALKTKQEAL